MLFVIFCIVLQQRKEAQGGITIIVYRYDENTKIYLKSEPAMLDPLETKAAGHNVYLLPANCTFTEPPGPREGYNIVYNTNTGTWQHEKQPEAEPAAPEPTEEEKKAAQIAALDASYAADKDKLLKYYLEAMATGDTELQADIVAELMEINKKYDDEMETLKNGKICD